jgi:hypothetical protein
MTMRIAIWQQWASNHSSSFVIVGEFGTAEAATAAAHQLHEMLTLIAQFREGYTGQEPTGPEVQFAQEYQLEWEHTLTWLALGPRLDLNADGGYLAIHQNRVFLSCGDIEASTGGRPLDQLMARLADRVLFEEETGEYSILVSLTCTAPHDDIAPALYDQLHAYLTTAEGGRIERTGTILSIQHMRMFYHLGTGLRALTAWLADHGCEDIKIDLIKSTESQQRKS